MGSVTGAGASTLDSPLCLHTVIGGGKTGLQTAYTLTQNNVDVTRSENGV